MKIFELDIKPKRKRQPTDPDIVDYKEVPKKKSDPTNIDKVVVTLKGKRSAYFTKLARRFARASRIKKMLSAEEKALKAETRNAVDDIFDAADEVYTRVVETAALVFKVAKAEERTAQILDEKGYLAELEKLTGLAVAELEKIRNKHVSHTVTKVDPKVLAPKEKKVKKESINEGFMDKIQKYASLVKQKTMAFLSQWDDKFASLEQDIEAELF